MEMERRKSKRLFFKPKKSISATFETSKKLENAITADLLSISSKGLSFALTRNKMSEIQPGDILTLKSIKSPELLNSLANIEMEVRYLLDFNIYINISYGCEFTKISHLQQEKIRKFVKKRLNTLDNSNS